MKSLLLVLCSLFSLHAFSAQSSKSSVLQFTKKHKVSIGFGKSFRESYNGQTQKDSSKSLQYTFKFDEDKDLGLLLNQFSSGSSEGQVGMSLNYLEVSSFVSSKFTPRFPKLHVLAGVGLLNEEVSNHSGSASSSASEWRATYILGSRLAFRVGDKLRTTNSFIANLDYEMNIRYIAEFTSKESYIDFKVFSLGYRF